MALRIRKNGRIMCAAMHPEEIGDTYIPDDLHYDMSVVHKVIVTEPHEKHSIHGEWWWSGNLPNGITIDEFYIKMENILTCMNCKKQFNEHHAGCFCPDCFL